MDNFVFVAHIEKITSLRKILNRGVLYDTKEKYHYPPLNILYSDDDGKYNWIKPYSKSASYYIFYDINVANLIDRVHTEGELPEWKKLTTPNRSVSSWVKKVKNYPTPGFLTLSGIEDYNFVIPSNTNVDNKYIQFIYIPDKTKFSKLKEEYPEYIFVNNLPYPHSE